MKWLVLVLICICNFANAAYNFECIPKTSFTPLAEGSKIVSVSSNAGKADAYWCPETLNGKIVYKQQYFIVLTKYDNKNRDDVYRRIFYSANFLTALNAEIEAATIVADPGSQDEFEWNSLKYQACLLLIKQPYMVPIVTPPSDFCGQQPTPPVASPKIYKTGISGSVIFKLLPNGSVDTVMTKKALPNSICDCTVKTTIGSGNYCPLANAPKNEVASCL